MATPRFLPYDRLVRFASARSFACVAMFFVSLALVACSSAPPRASDGSTDILASPLDIGKACTPAAESSPAFPGTLLDEVSLETNSPSCVSGLCLSNHFQGRVTCPYGQDDQHQAPSGAAPCATPGGSPVTSAVKPQCTDRIAAQAVYCSCRCANADGKTDDGDGPYCTCGDGFTCAQLIAPIGMGDDSLAGAYCIKDGTQFAANVACASTCDPSTTTCP